MVYCIYMTDSLGVDLEEIINSKMDKNVLKVIVLRLPQHQAMV